MQELFSPQQQAATPFSRPAAHPQYAPVSAVTAAGPPGRLWNASDYGSAYSTASMLATSHALTVEGARRAMGGAIAEADRHGWPVTIVIVDHSGTPLLLERRGAAPITVDLALGKARTAAHSGRESAVFEHSVNGDPMGGHPSRRPRIALLSAPMLIMEGALPILVGGSCIGAVGCAGVRSDQDAQVARAGVQALAGAVSAASAASIVGAVSAATALGLARSSAEEPTAGRLMGPWERAEWH